MECGELASRATLDNLFNVPTILSLIIGGILFYFWFKRPCSKFPPGPRGIPILGCIPFLGVRPEVKFLEYTKSYGNIFSVRIGRQEWVVLNDSEVLHQVLLKNGAHTATRPPSPLIEKSSNYIGLVSVKYDKTYKSLKHFGVSTLRGFGVGKKSMEDCITEELKYVNDAILANNKQAFDIKDIISKAICNNLASVIFGSRFEYDDPMFIEIVRIIGITATDPKTVTTFKIVTFAPMFEYIPPFRGHIQNLLQEIKKELVLFTQLIDEHKRTFDKDNLRDFTDAFILKMEENTDPTFYDEQLLQFTRELFVAGTETSSSTIRWGILCLLHYPQTEKKIYKEIMNVVGAEGEILYSKREEMPYTSAFIEELYRYRTIAPLGLPHATSADFNVEGFRLPTGTLIMANHWGVHNNPKHWNEPEKFIPERHLNEKGEFVKSKNVNPFGVGLRACIGEQLARMEVFIYFVSLVQKFHFEPNPNETQLPDINKYRDGLVCEPYPYKIIANER